MKHILIKSYDIIRQLMKKALVILFLLMVCFPLYGAYYWDYPVNIVKSTDRETYSDVNSIYAHGRVMIFTLSSRRGSYSIEFFTTGDFDLVEGPFRVVGRIEKSEGFFPHYDVLLYHERIYLVWNTLLGDLKFIESSDGGRTWTRERILEIEEAFSFDPRLYVIGDELYLFYHTGSEGRRIDFFYIKGMDSGGTVTQSIQIARGFAGSFFPYLISREVGSFDEAEGLVGDSGAPAVKQDDMYIVWQSRPFSEQETSIFDIYLAISEDRGGTWSPPLNLTEDVLGESTRPFIFFEEDKFSLLWEGDRDGAWGIYYREYDLEGKPLGEPLKINRSLVNAIEAKFLQTKTNKLVFYIDERDGQNRLYVAGEEDGEWVESGPISSQIINYEPVQVGDILYIIVEDSEGLAYIGPDRKVQRLTLDQPLASRIGSRGTIVSWAELEDSSGIEGYCYLFNQNEFDEPEIVNLSPHIRTLNLTPENEGGYFLHLRARDRAGNLSDTLTIPFEVDFTPPAMPSIATPEYDRDGFYKNNSPFIQWSAEDDDIAGYNYVLSRKKLTLDTPRLRTKRTKASFDNLEGGTWYFNVASVDHAGNVGPTAHVEIRLRQILKDIEVEKPEEVFLWMLSRRSFEGNPFLNISLYILLGGLFCITLFISLDVVVRYFSLREEKAMEAEVRKKRLGLRFKFSILIGALVLLLTIGISTILSVVSIEQEKRALAHQMYDKAILSLENMTNVAREGILNNDELLLLSVVSKTMENKDIKHSVILNNRNEVVAHSDFNRMGEMLEDPFTKEAQSSETILISPEFSAEELGPLYELASPVVFSGRRIGTVRIGYSTDSIFLTIDELRRKSLYNSILITLGTIVLGIVGAVLLATLTIKPIKILAKGVDIIGSGKLDHKIHVKARDEIGILADEFNRMTERLLEYQQQMEMKAKLDEQLDIARGIQQDLIPSVGIDNDRISIDGYYKAASGVGGDYYDFIEIGQGSYGLIMSDVAGKGVPASLMMIMIRSVFKSLIHSGVSDPSRVTTLMNNTLASDISSDRFATLFFAVFNMKNKTMRYTNAGYGPLMIYKAKQKQCILVNPPEGSFPIGVMDDVDYIEEKPIKLGRGDSVFLFTDGIHEARDTKENEYGIDRLSELIPSFADKDSKEMANLIINDVLEFVGDAEQYDDMTLMVMKVK
ncbi:MAG: SpoIIE family protein phosphatase [Spirochaetota bacterium]|nr:MAG: SpoIIE family protein phosphatase [Spirochaetota bacterium]